jgi:TonB family protein
MINPDKLSRARYACVAFAVLSMILLIRTKETAEERKQALPTVESAAVPFYPPLARVARIEGTVRLRVWTEGKRVSVISTESGHPLLATAAEANVRTWQFTDRGPTTFEVTFEYKMLQESQCEMDNGTVLLRLPTEVEVSAKGVQTCDPVEKVNLRR